MPCCYTSQVQKTVQYFMGTGGRCYFRRIDATLFYRYGTLYSTSRVPEVVGTSGAMLLHFTTQYSTVRPGYRRSSVLQGQCCYTSLHSTVQYVQGTGGRGYYRGHAATLYRVKNTAQYFMGTGCRGYFRGHAATL